MGCTGYPSGPFYFCPADAMVIHTTISVQMRRAGVRRSILPQPEEHPMRIPVWFKPGVWGVGVGAVAMAIVGFTQLGWTTSGNAELLAQERASTAVVAALVPFCVAKAQQDPGFRDPRNDSTKRVSPPTIPDYHSPSSPVTRMDNALLKRRRRPASPISRVRRTIATCRPAAENLPS